MNNHHSRHSPVIHPPSTCTEPGTVGMYLEHLRDIVFLSRGARSDGQISLRVRTYSRGMLIPTRQFYASLLKHSCPEVFQLSTTHKWGEFHAKTGVAISDKQFLRLSTHFTSLDLLQEGRGDSRQTNTPFFAMTNNRINRSASGLQLARSLARGSGGGCSAMQCNAINTLHPYRIASHYARTIHTALKGPGRPLRLSSPLGGSRQLQPQLTTL